MIMGHPTLNANVRVAAEALALAGLLGEFHTTIDTTRMSQWVPGQLGKSLARRSLPPSVSRLTRSHPTLEIGRLLSRFSYLSSSASSHFTVDAVYAGIDANVAARITGETSGVYAYEDGALRTFTRALELDIPRVYDLPIGYWRAGRLIAIEEAELNPAWASTLQGLTDSPSKLHQKDLELQHASLVLVASTFTLRTLQASYAAVPPVRVIPYGAPPVVQQVTFSRKKTVKALYVGSLTQRKGISYMFEAVRSLGDDVELTVVGRREGASDALDAALLSVKWYESLSHPEILALMRNHDVLLFPSLFEGFGLVLTEALSQGLPIITTPNTAGPDLITQGEEGWIVPIRSSTAIAECLTKLVEDLDLRNEMKTRAVKKAGRLRWERYQAHLVGAVREIV